MSVRKQFSRMQDEVFPGLIFIILLKKSNDIMNIQINAPSPGESIREVLIASWLVKDADIVEKDAELAEIESDKATLMVSAPQRGKISILVKEGETVPVGTLIATMETDDVQEPGLPKNQSVYGSKAKENPATEESQQQHISPLAKKIIAEKNIPQDEIYPGFENKRVTKKDILDLAPGKSQLAGSFGNDTRPVKREKMSPLRLKIAERLVAVKNETAMLTSFNEIDMRQIIDLREKFNATFNEKYGYTIGYMGFFIKAATLSLFEFPQVNAMIDGEEIVYFKYTDINVAMSTPKGLVAPVIRNTDKMSIIEIEKKVKELGSRAGQNRISPEELESGTFTITNGGVFGSLMSTPIINPPQAAILGMHKIIDRPVAVNGKVEIHPMMYVALSYDHRLIDGKEAVGFLMSLKKAIENPVEILLEGADPVDYFR
jgi:2-oxoglutarate dehydrogenase E2 component (dihydrolipoamide succinyltransferase)